MVVLPRAGSDQRGQTICPPRALRGVESVGPADEFFNASGVLVAKRQLGLLPPRRFHWRRAIVLIVTAVPLLWLGCT